MDHTLCRARVVCGQAALKPMRPAEHASGGGSGPAHRDHALGVLLDLQLGRLVLRSEGAALRFSYTLHPAGRVIPSTQPAPASAPMPATYQLVALLVLRQQVGEVVAVQLQHVAGDAEGALACRGCRWPVGQSGDYIPVMCSRTVANSRPEAHDCLPHEVNLPPQAAAAASDAPDHPHPHPPESRSMMWYSSLTPRGVRPGILSLP